MRYVWNSEIPPFDRVLLVESGGRGILDRFLPLFYQKIGSQMEVDLVTCFPGVPKGFRGDVYRVADYVGAPARGRLYAKLAARGYSSVGILCCGEPIMTKWKWALAFRLPSKVFLINEHSDFIFFDRANKRGLLQFLRVRAGLTGTSLIPALARLIAFPFALVYLLIFAGAVHFKRRMRAT